jgi:hypothetical protein
MRIGRWTLEVLVNERPLQEYVISDSILGVNIINYLLLSLFSFKFKNEQR